MPQPAPAKPWSFAIDVGGTFTDCIARTPEGELRTLKVLSSGVTKGRISQRTADDRFVDLARRDDPPDFWRGYAIALLESDEVARGLAQLTAIERKLRGRPPSDVLADGETTLGEMLDAVRFTVEGLR